MEKNYWCFRTNKKLSDFFYKELLENRLRQGWGWDEKQDLRALQMDQGAKRNLRMFNRVKKGDILLIPHLPIIGEVALVEATEDWNKGYKFEISENGDYGHIFPAKYFKKFKRSNENVTGNLRSTLKNPQRFWNINHYANDVEKLLNTEENKLSTEQDKISRLDNSFDIVFSNIFNENEFKLNIYNKLNEQFTNEEWEYALVYGLQKLYPHYIIERVGGTSEVHHGTDILIRIPNLLAEDYVIAVQVKDYHGFVSSKVINQINKADAYWDQKEGVRLIEKVVIITKADKSNNLELTENESNVKFLFAEDLKELLFEIGKAFIKESL